VYDRAVADSPAPPFTRGRASPERLSDAVVLADARRPRAQVRCPWDGSVLASVPLGGGEDVGEAVRRARVAQGAWAALPLERRTEVFTRLHDAILERKDEVLDLVQLETGKARRDALEELLDVALVARYYTTRADDHLRPRRRRGVVPGLTSVREYRHPLGVVGVIAPWNYPLSLTLSDAIPALVAGNAVVIKPDVETPLSALLAGEVLADAGLPAGLYSVVTGSGEDAGAALVRAVDFVAFTGSTATGRDVAAAAGARLAGASLELGGKNPMLVLADADVSRAVDGAVRGCFSNAGQLCVSIERIYVHEDLAERFTEALVAASRRLRVGPGLTYEHDMGALISPEHLARVAAHVEEALEAGALLLAGGRARPDLGPTFYEPTLLGDVRPGMRVLDEETFGPVASITPFATVDEAVRMANDSPYGLNASVWTEDLEFGQRVALRLQCGTVNVNEAYAAAWGSVDAPMGGMKASGMGRRHGAEGILRYTRSQTVATQRLHAVDRPRRMSDERFDALTARALKLMRHIPGIR
jgi:succinate-semialdehyde dehydrogenase/glutarate-semialdehyde dehydrogenase